MMNLRDQDLSLRDFSAIKLTGAVLAGSTLTGCRFGECTGANFVRTSGEGIDFRGAVITRTTFEQAKESVLRCLPGATWDGIEITGVTGWLTQDYYWCFATNAFVQCGCMQRTLEEWQTICRDAESIKVLHDEQPRIDLVAALAWWRQHEVMIGAAVAALRVEG